MRQLITRIDDDLHARLKQRAADEGRSVNDLVTQVLNQALERRAARERLRERARRAGLLFEPPSPDVEAPLDAALAATRGAGPAFSVALTEVREGR